MDCAEKRRTVRFFKDTKMHGRIFVSEIQVYMLSKKNLRKDCAERRYTLNKKSAHNLRRFFYSRLNPIGFSLSLNSSSFVIE